MHNPYETPQDNKTPLTDETFINMSIQRDEWEDERNIKRQRQGFFTNLWLFIIAMYCLFNLLKELIPIILSLKIINQLIAFF